MAFAGCLISFYHIYWINVSAVSCEVCTVNAFGFARVFQSYYILSCQSIVVSSLALSRPDKWNNRLTRIGLLTAVAYVRTVTLPNEVNVFILVRHSTKYPSVWLFVKRSPFKYVSLLWLGLLSVVQSFAQQSARTTPHTNRTSYTQKQRHRTRTNVRQLPTTHRQIHSFRIPYSRARTQANNHCARDCWLTAQSLSLLSRFVRWESETLN